MRNFLLILILISSIKGVSQTVVSGVVLTSEGESIPGANIWIKGSYDGGTSNGEGFFQFETSLRDSLVLKVSFIGYEEISLPLGKQSEELRIELRKDINELTAVSITAGTIEVSDKVGSVVMKPLDILTTAGAIGDITGALNTLPGTANVANDGRLFVRGGDATETAIFFDGLRVGDAYGTTAKNLPTRNRFNPTLFKGTFFSTGGYSAEYGDALSSILSMQSIDTPVRNQTDISLMSVGGSVATTLVGDEKSISAEISGFNLGPYQKIVKQNFDWEKAPESYSGQVVFRHDIGKTGIIKGFAQASTSSMILWQKQPGVEGRGVRTRVDNDFAFANASHSLLISNKWKSEGGLSISSSKDKYGLDSINYQAVSALTHIKEKLTHFVNDQLKVRLGAEVFAKNYESSDLNMNQSIGFKEFRSGAFSEIEWYASNNFTLKGGLRASHSNLTKDWFLQPRLAAAYRVYKEGSISMAAGYFNQPQNDRYRLSNAEMEDSRASHVQLSFQHGSSTRTFRAEVYAKTYKDLGVLGDQAPTSDGSGYANGFDMFYRDRKTVKNLDFWITYSFVDSKRRYGQFNQMVQPSFAPRHNFAIVGKYWVDNLKSQFGAAYSANSGYSYHNPNLPGEMQSMSPNYGSLSINWSYLIRQNLILHVACNNVLGRENIFGYQFANEADDSGAFSGIPLEQSATRFAFIGIFWSISSDKQANQLNNL